MVDFAQGSIAQSIGVGRYTCFYWCILYTTFTVWLRRRCNHIGLLRRGTCSPLLRVRPRSRMLSRPSKAKRSALCYLSTVGVWCYFDILSLIICHAPIFFWRGEEIGNAQNCASRRSERLIIGKQTIVNEKINLHTRDDQSTFWDKKSRPWPSCDILWWVHWWGG